MRAFMEDLRYASRSLARQPALLAITTLTLSIAIAANAIMFGVVDQLLLRPPPLVAAPDGVKRIYHRDVQDGTPSYGSVTTYPLLTSLRQHTDAFSDLAAFSFKSDYSLGRGANARSVSVQLVSANFFRLLGVKPIIGSGFNDDYDRLPQSDRVAIVSYGFWQQELGADAHAVGRQLPLQGQTFTVVGVAPRGFAGVDREKIDIWIPIASFGDEAFGKGWHNTTNNGWAQIIGRVRPHVTDEVAAAQATSAYRGFLKQWGYKERESSSSIVLSSLVGGTPEGMSWNSKVSLWLMGVSAIVLLIACANVANLLIARTMQRRREISVRLALGITRGRLLRMLLTEAALLAALGCVAAIALAFSAGPLVQRVLLPDIVWNESVIDGRILFFTLGVTTLCVLLAGLAPAIQGIETRVSEGLKVSTRHVAGSRGALRFALMLAQAALSVLLLVGAGLFVKSLRNVVRRDVGIDRDRVLRVTMPLRRFGFDSIAIEDIYRRGAERLREVPGVTSVAVVRLSVPLGMANATHFSVPGVERKELPGGGPYNSVVSRGFFRTIGAAILRGRDFTEVEGRVPSRVVIVNDMLAKAYWPDQDPIGKCVMIGADNQACSEVIGVSQTVMQFFLVDDDRAMVYAPTGHPGFPSASPSALLVRVAGAIEPARLVPIVRREMQALAPTMPFVGVQPYSDLVLLQLRPRRLGATMFTVFGFIALAIAAVGLYSVMAFWVSQRTHEIGVRMALGAAQWDVVRLVAIQSSRPIVLGLLAGSLGAMAAGRFVAELLYETSPRDPIVYASAALALALAAAVASIVPARRSAAVDPALAMRVE